MSTGGVSGQHRPQQTQSAQQTQPAQEAHQAQAAQGSAAHPAGTPSNDGFTPAASPGHAPTGQHGVARPGGGRDSMRARVRQAPAQPTAPTAVPAPAGPAAAPAATGPSQPPASPPAGGPAQVPSNVPALILSEPPLPTDHIRERVMYMDREQFPAVLDRLAQMPPTYESAQTQAAYMDAIGLRQSYDAAAAQRGQGTAFSPQLEQRVIDGNDRVWSSNGQHLLPATDRVAQGRTDGADIIENLGTREAASAFVRDQVNGWDSRHPGSNTTNFPQALRLVGAALADDANVNRHTVAENVIQGLTDQVDRLAQTDVGRIHGMMDEVSRLSGPGSSEARAMLAQAVARVVNNRSVNEEGFLTTGNSTVAVNNMLMRDLVGQRTDARPGLAALVQSDPVGIYSFLGSMDAGGAGRDRGDLAMNVNRALIRTPIGQAALGDASAHLTAEAIRANEDHTLPDPVRREIAGNLGYFNGTMVRALQNYGSNEDERISAEREVLGGLSRAAGTIFSAVTGNDKVGEGVRNAADHLTGWYSDHQQSSVNERVNGMYRNFMEYPMSAYNAMLDVRPGMSRTDTSQFFQEYQQNYHNYLVPSQLR